jgi:hypothetical protein
MVPSSTSPRRPGRGWRILLGLVVLGVSAVAAAVLWLTRDPLPHFQARRSKLQSVTEYTPARAGGYVTQGVRLRATSGLSVDLLVRAPDTSAVPADPGTRRPLYLILGGYRTGDRAATLITDTRGAVVAALAYPYAGPVDVKGIRIIGQVPAIRRAILDTPPAIQVALDHLLTRPDVDFARVELVGASFGVPFATIGAALDDRVSRLWLAHGAARPRQLLEHGLRRSIPWAPARAVVAAVAYVLAGGPRLAPEVWIPRVSPRPVIMINAADDERLPRQAIDALYASARPPKERIWLTGGHVLPGRTDVIRDLVETVLSRAARP